VQVEGRAAARDTVGEDEALTLFDDPVHHRQAQAGVLAFFLGRKEGFENV